MEDLSAATGLHDHLEPGPVRQAAGRGPSRQPFAFHHLTPTVGKGQLEDIFCQVDRDRRSIVHVDSLRAPDD